MTKTKNNIAIDIEKLEKIVDWFQTQTQVQVEEGLAKVKEGAELIKSLKGRLKDVENEFEEIKKDIKEGE